VKTRNEMELYQCHQSISANFTLKPLHYSAMHVNVVVWQPIK